MVRRASGDLTLRHFHTLPASRSASAWPTLTYVSGVVRQPNGGVQSLVLMCTRRLARGGFGSTTPEAVMISCSTEVGPYSVIRLTATNLTEPTEWSLASACRITV